MPTSRQTGSLTPRTAPSSAVALATWVESAPPAAPLSALTAGAPATAVPVAAASSHRWIVPVILASVLETPDMDRTPGPGGGLPRRGGGRRRRHGTVGRSDHRTIEPSDSRTIGRSDSRTIGPWGHHGRAEARGRPSDPQGVRRSGPEGI